MHSGKYIDFNKMSTIAELGKEKPLAGIKNDVERQHKRRQVQKYLAYKEFLQDCTTIDEAIEKFMTQKMPNYKYKSVKSKN